MRPRINPKVDYAFKRLFGKEGNEPLLASLLHGVLQLPPGQQLDTLHLRNPFHNRETWDDYLAVVDVKARDAQGRQYTVEVQLLLRPYFPERLLYYWARLYPEPLSAGADYSALQPTYVVCFLDAVLFRGHGAQYHWRFGVRDDRHPEVMLTPQLAIHVLELPKFTAGAGEIQTPLEQWLYFLRHAEELDTEAWPATLGLPAIKRAMEELVMVSQSELERERYEARLRVQRDQAILEKAGELRWEEGRQEGWREGLMEQIHLLQRLLKRPPTAAAELQRLSVDELQRLAQQLEQEIVGFPSPPAGDGSRFP